MKRRYLIKLALPLRVMTYKIAKHLEWEYDLKSSSITTEPGYFFADVPAHTEIQLAMDPRVRELELVT